MKNSKTLETNEKLLIDAFKLQNEEAYDEALEYYFLNTQETLMCWHQSDHHDWRLHQEHLVLYAGDANHEAREGAHRRKGLPRIYT